MENPPPISISDSYYYQFCNSLALLFLILAGIISFFCLYRHGHKSNNSFFFKTYFNTSEYTSSLKEKKKLQTHYWLLYILSSIPLLYFLWIIQSTIPFYGERGYFLTRLYILQDGLKPHLDFGFAYGQLLLILPFYISRLLQADVLTGYLIAFMIESFIGFYCLWYIIKKSIPQNHQRYIFLAIFIPAYIGLFAGASNYTLFRFATPLLLSILFYEKTYKNPKTIYLLISTALLFFTTSIISPELGLVSLFAFLISIVIRYKFCFWIIIKSLFCLVLVGALINYIPFIKNSYTSLFILSEGGFNFPWFFCPTIIIFLLFIFISLIFTIKYNKSYDNPIIVIFLFSFFALPGAMGRCDVGHLFYYGLGFFIIVLYIIPYFKKIIKNLLICLYISIAICFTCSITMLYIRYIKAFIQYHAPTVQFKYEYKETPDTLELICIKQLLLNHQQKPLLITGEPFFFQDSFIRKRVSFPYFLNNTDNFTTKTNRILLQNINQHNIIILPQNNPFHKEYKPFKNNITIALFGLPISLIYSKVNNPISIYQQIIETLNQNYQKDTLFSKKYFIYTKIE